MLPPPLTVPQREPSCPFNSSEDFTFDNNIMSDLHSETVFDFLLHRKTVAATKVVFLSILFSSPQQPQLRLRA